MRNLLLCSSLHQGPVKISEKIRNEWEKALEDVHSLLSLLVAVGMDKQTEFPEA